ncbi:MAG: hypothetical protein JO287_27420 [Pseudonocardiales bacterium]|nr:hypothetical protein [Pseudonocardiales bacterium]
MRPKLNRLIIALFRRLRSRPPRQARRATVTLIAISFVLLPTPELKSTVDYHQIVFDEGYWVATAQLTCNGDGAGAIAQSPVIGPGKVSVHPYEANWGARAMVAAGPRYLPMVKRYIQWYLGHLNWPDQHGVYGTIYDYDYDPATCIGTYQADPRTGATPKYDSTDAYAGTFLSLVRHYAEANPADSSFLRSPQTTAGLRRIADVITATWQPNGLTDATPSYPAQYLMDNVEAQRGLQDYAWFVANVLGDQAAALVPAVQAASIRSMIALRLWQLSRTPGMYGWAADQLSPSWASWYPDAIAQLWPVWDLLGPSARRSTAWRQFASRWPTWVNSTPAFGSSGVAHDPNAHVAYAAAQAGDRAALDDYLSRSEINWIRHGRPPPWTVADSGFRALAALTGASL